MTQQVVSLTMLLQQLCNLQSCLLLMSDAGEVIIHKDECVAEVSKIFKWYKQDFGPQERLFPWLVQYLSGSSKADLQELLDTVGAKHIHVKYRHYDWALNSQE